MSPRLPVVVIIMHYLTMVEERYGVHYLFTILIQSDHEVNSQFAHICYIQYIINFALSFLASQQTNKRQTHNQTQTLSVQRWLRRRI